MRDKHGANVRIYKFFNHCFEHYLKLKIEDRMAESVKLRRILVNSTHNVQSYTERDLHWGNNYTFTLKAYGTG